MICADARHLIHLDAGGDLPLQEEHLLAEHMESCSECRSYNSGMVSAMSALHVLRDFDSAASGLSSGSLSGSRNANASSGGRSSSVWADLSSRLPARTPAFSNRRQFNSRVAALCACSLVLAVVSIVQNLPVNNYSASADFGMSSRLPAMAQPASRFSQPTVTTVGGFSSGMPSNRMAVLNADGTVAGYLQFEDVNTSEAFEHLPVSDADAAASF